MGALIINKLHSVYKYITFTVSNKLIKSHNYLNINARRISLSSAQCNIQNMPLQLSVKLIISNIICITKYKLKQKTSDLIKNPRLSK